MARMADNDYQVRLSTQSRLRQSQIIGNLPDPCPQSSAGQLVRSMGLLFIKMCQIIVVGIKINTDVQSAREHS